MSKFQQYLNESSKLPSKFKSGDDFMTFVYDRFKHKDTYVEHQGSGAWFAEIHAGGQIKQATYDSKSKEVIWQDSEGEEI